VTGACERCLSRTWLLRRLAGHLDVARPRLYSLLELEDEDLVAAVAGRERARIDEERRSIDLDGMRREATKHSLALICRCDALYPAVLHDLAAPPAVLHIAGELDRLAGFTGGGSVAVVGSRRASEYGNEVGRSLGRSLAGAGLTVISGMARGIDTAAHRGSLESTGATISVLPGAACEPYPPGNRRLHRSIVARGVVLSELGPGAPVRRWCFHARNRLIAALSGMTVVVEAGEQSGSLVTAAVARALARPVGAVPGRVTSPAAAGTNALLASGAAVIRDAQDVLDQLYGIGARSVSAAMRPALSSEQEALLAALADAPSTEAALAGGSTDADRALVMLAELELAGWVRRGAGGRFTVIP